MPDDSILPAELPSQRVWSTTPWSAVARLDSARPRVRESGWGEVVGAYGDAIEAYLARALERLRGKPCPPQDAAEAAQDFMGLCAEKGWLSRADPQRGPFRAFLQMLLRRFAVARVRFERARRRHPGEGRRIFSMRDTEVASLPGKAEAPELAAFDKTWAQVAVERARARLRREHARYVLVIEDLIRTEGAGSPDMAARLRVRPQQYAVIRHRARQRFLRLFLQELRATVADEEQLAAEWRVLRPYLP